MAQRGRLRASRIAVGVLCLFVIGLFGTEFNQITETPLTSWNEDQAADCAIVLTGGPGRVREGLDLLARGSVKKLIVAGTHPKAQLREIFPMWPYFGGVDEGDIFFERRSRTTYGNAQQTLPLAEGLGCGKILLVTSRIHMHRALRTFRRTYPSDIQLLSQPTTPGFGESEVREILFETVKSLFYQLWIFDALGA